MNIVCKKEFKVRILLLIFLLLTVVKSFGAGFTPTDGGLVVNLKPGDQILISTMVDTDGDGTPDTEFFVENYTRYYGGYFNYKNDSTAYYLKLIPQGSGVTEPAEMSIWTVDTALTRVDKNNYAGGGSGKDYALGGISYTIWNDNRTLRTNGNNRYVFYGDLEAQDKNTDKYTDVVFVIPTAQPGNASFDPKTPNGTMGRGTLFDSRTGTGFLGMTYREVYWLEIPRFNAPVNYTNAAVVTFNTTTSEWTGKRCGNIKPGRAAYAYADDTKKPNHSETPRTIFRLYILNEPMQTCPNTYFFAYDEQDYKQYRKGPDTNVKPNLTWGDSTDAKKVYTMDCLFRMDRVGDSQYYQTGLMYVPVPDSSYYYVGWNNEYRNGSDGTPSEPLGSSTAKSEFTKIRELPLQHMPSSLKAPVGALGRMIVDMTSAADNLGVVFRPAGVFLKVDAGEGRYRNIEMHPEPGDTSWICNEMWTITDEYAALHIKATLYTQPNYSDSDPGQDIEGWSEYIVGSTVPLAGGGGTVTGDMTGWARVYTNKSSKNGGLEFVRAEKDKYVRYDNNGHFGASIPATHAVAGEDTAVVQDHRLINGYNFRGWYTKADTTAGDGTWYQPGDVVTFTDSDKDGKDSLILYAQAKYEGGISVAISFMKDGKRYFLTHPGAAAPRYARARDIADWTDTWQGMANADNLDPHYLTTYLLVGKNTICAECYPNEYVFDPKRETVKGAIDSVIFYEHFSPNKEEYPGLYYSAPNTILANDTWAGLFQSSEGWPTPGDPCIENTKLSSTHYLSGFPSTITREVRGNNAEGSNIVYNEALNQFDATTAEGTDFTISGVGVVDQHFVILPDTTDKAAQWIDSLTFGLHNDEQTKQPVWSKLIGKQLMLHMTLGDKIVYFHPNNAKTKTTASELRLSNDYRIAQTFSYIRDARVEALGSVSDENKPHMSETSNDFSRLITSGVSSPMNVQYEGNYIDIVDTIRVALRPMPNTKIKEYYGRWEKKSADDGLHINPDRSRYRDILVRTKTYHYGPTTTQLILTPEFDTYAFNPLADNSRIVNFTLTKVTSRPLLDKDNHVIREEIYSTEDVTSSLQLGPSACSFTFGDTYFRVEDAVLQQVVLAAQGNNEADDNHDTLVISTSVKLDAVSYPVTARVPLVQTSLAGDELIWSVVDNKQRYFIMAGTGGLIFRKFKLSGSMLYKENTTTPLEIGSADPENNDTKYITPWKFSYNPGHSDQLSLKTEYGVNRYIKMPSETTGAKAGIHESEYSFFTFHYVKVYTNDNANYEEQVKLQFGSSKWLKFSTSPSLCLELVDSEAEASVFSWTYLLKEYSVLEDGQPYPNKNQLVFGYNGSSSSSVITRYKARREYSMLLDGVSTYCSRYDERTYANLIDENQEWKTTKEISIIPDARPGVPASGLSITGTFGNKQETTVTPSGVSPTNVQTGGKYVDIVDTLYVQYSLKDDAPSYRFKSDWTGFTSIEEANLKIPLIRKTYHEEHYDSLVCLVEGDEYNHTFPNTITVPVSHTFTLSTERRTGYHVLDVENKAVAVHDAEKENVTISGGMDLDSVALAEVRLIDEFGNTPSWCSIAGKGTNTITVQCTESGIRSPRTANIYIAYIVMIDDDGNPATPKKMRFLNYRLTVSQPSLYEYANNQTLNHSTGASGDPLDDKGMQQVHQNKRILYYYPDQNVELPVRESHFFGWWRWFREGEGEIGDSDIPDTVWRTMPRNVAGKYNYPFRIIGDSVPVDPENPAAGKKLVTKGRYTVFHYKSKDYPNVRLDPPIKTALVAPPTVSAGIPAKPTVTYAVDISNYYDKLPMSVSQKNQVDTAYLDTMIKIPEPTLSLREVFELHPWTEMATRLEGFKSERTTNDAGEYELASERYMEDHTVMAPLKNQLLLSTEQRYSYTNLAKGGHSESLLGYYMHDDNWSSMSAVAGEGGWSRQDSMIWCGGWDADCLWYTYNPKTKKYTRCNYKITDGDDFLIVPAKENIPAGKEFDTVYYCLRARSWATTGDPSLPPGTTGAEATDSGSYMFNICRYKIIYHQPAKYGPVAEVNGKALITNDEIEQRYEVLERLNFDYNKPGSSYTVYPHPLPWGDASYGYTYPETPDLPHNRLHEQSDFPNMGEYGLINRIPYSDYWYKMEQHGGAANGYMIYCDGMSSSGQVAALSLNTHLCSGQKMFFSGYVCNPSNQNPKKSCPNFTIDVQGSVDNVNWDNITSYTTGDIQPSNTWNQIYFPIIFNDNKDYEHFRVRIYNVSSNWDGNDFIIDDLCIFATKPPLIAYQANTTCKEKGEEDKPTHVLLRVDYQGITGEGYNNVEVYYTVKCVNKDGVTSFVKMEDGYLNEEKHPKADEFKPDTICGKLYIPARDYEPVDADSIFVNMDELIDTFTVSDGAFREGYIYEILEGDIRPVKYVVHEAFMNPKDTFTVHMSHQYKELLSSICGMTSHLKISNQMVLELNGDELPDTEQLGLCANATYDIGLRVKGSLYLDSVAPINLNGTCRNDWLLYGDTVESTSEALYGYKYSDIVKVVKDILRCAPPGTTNSNQFAPNLAAVSRNEMTRIMEAVGGVDLSTDDHPYDVLANLVNRGFLTLYQSNVTATVYSGDSVQYVIFPILGTGSDAMHSASVEVCTNPIFIKLKPDPESAKAPLIVGGLNRPAGEMNQPIVVLANSTNANNEISLKVDSIMPLVGIRSVELVSTDDPDYNEEKHILQFVPDKEYPIEDYYLKGDYITLRPAASNNYYMKQGYSYTFGIVMQTILGKDTVDGGCQVGTVPFTLSVVPDYLRWDPQEGNMAWNNPGNWIGITQSNEPIHADARFAPLPTSYVIVPPMTDGKPYPVLPATISSEDSVKQVGFAYNTCQAIRFMPGAAMGQQQRMDYNKAIVDVPLPHNKWALRAAPVNGMLSGDIFMSNADLNMRTSPWEVGTFDAAGRNYSTGNGSYWLSVYSRTTVDKGNGDNVTDTTRTAAADWSKVTNGMDLPLPPASGFAVYAYTKSGRGAEVRLPKSDDIYYYYYPDGEKALDYYVSDLQTKRTSAAGGDASKVGKLAFAPGVSGTSQSYTITNDNSVATSSFVFGNPTMGYIDIWGLIADNAAQGLKAEFDYIDADGIYRTISQTSAQASPATNVLTNPQRYLPPTHAIVLKKSEGTATSLTLVLNTNRIVTAPVIPTPSSAPRYKVSPSPLGEGRGMATQGIMTVTAVNPASPRCTSRLLLGQGYNDAVIPGEDAVLTTVNINNYTNNSMPATPFNIYALEGSDGLSIDLRHEVLNVPVSFYITPLPYEPVTYLWFTGVNNIDGELVLYDAWEDTERPIMDGIRIDIETPQVSHLTRYYIRRPGYRPSSEEDQPIATSLEATPTGETAIKIIKDNHVFILRDGHIYTVVGQKWR